MFSFYKATLHLHNLTWWIILGTGLWAVVRVCARAFGPIDLDAA